VILGSIDSDATLCEVDPTTGAGNYIASESGSIFRIVTSPDGSNIVLPVNPGIASNQVVLYDAHTLSKAAQFSVAGTVGSASDFAFSADSETLFVPNDAFVYAYSTAGQQLGWLPNITIEYLRGGFAVGPAASPVYEAVDSSGLLVGPAEEGFAFLDTTLLRTGPVGTGFLNAYPSPTSGPTGGGTQVQWEVPTATLQNPVVYFGGNQSPTVSVSNGVISANAPPGNPGPTPIYLLTGDGGVQLIADGFSYGPSILEVTPNASTAGGSTSGVIYGYGFGPTNSATIPPNLIVSVGGEPATITGYNPDAYSVTSQPFQLEAIYYSIPSGPSGTSADVAVTSSSGGSTAHNGLSYLPQPQQFPLHGSHLAQGVYDPIRDVYYFTDTSSVEVFSLSQQQWLNSISIPAPPGSMQRLWGIGISPDGSKLAVSDTQANVIYLVTLTNDSVQTFPFVYPNLPQGVLAHPVGVAVSNGGVVYFTVQIAGGSGYHAFFKLDTNSGTLKDYGIDGPDFYSDGVPQDLYLRAEISSDNSRVFFNADGDVFSIETASDTIVQAKVNQGCCYGNYDLALSANQTQFAASNYLYDSSLNAASLQTLNDREALDVAYVYGTKFSPDGTLLFQPSTSGIDVFDGRLGVLLSRIALPFALSTNYDALVGDGHDNVLLAILGSNTSIAVVDLTSLSEPAPVPYPSIVRSATGFERSSGNGNRRPGSGTMMPRGHVTPHVTGTARVVPLPQGSQR
jgi:hypothetical protein